MSKIKIFALGGLNEMGKNMYVVNVDKDIFIFDAGLKYPEDAQLGVDYIIPDFTYLKDNIKNIKGIFLSHGHDENIGAMCDILEQLPDIKVYGTKFTLDTLRKDLDSENIKYNNLIEILPNKKIDFKNNSIFPISLTHDVPGNLGYVLNTLDGSIVYTGNFVFDSTMLKDYKTDIGKLAYIGKQSVLCLLSESIYASKEGFTSPSNRTLLVLKQNITDNGRIIYNTFNNQLYRIQELLTAIKSTHRDVVILGKNLESYLLNCIDEGYLEFDKTRILSLNHINDNNVVIIVSDEREKAFSNLNRIAKGYDKFVKLKENDTIIFASPIFDGLEKTSTQLFDDISKIGCKLVIISNKKYRSYDASSEDLMMMINLMQPKYYFPIIGEYRHQVANKEVALKLGMKEENILLNLNGQVATFENGKLIDNSEKITVNELLIDGKMQGDIGDLVLKDREMLADNGIVVVVVTLDKSTKKIIAGPEILTRGFIYVKENIDLIKESGKIAQDVISEFTNSNYIDYSKVRNSLREKVGNYFYNETECRPMILSVIQEI